jgi:membrane associated rhomboid family serine protease
MHTEQKKIINSFIFPSILILLLWVIELGEIATGLDLSFLGVYPQRTSGLLGIITGPMVHGDLKHLFANSVPLFVLGSALFFFYKDIALRVFILIYIITGFSVWAGARDAYHIGISGVVYGLASFLFFSGIIRRDLKLLAITMFVTFLYGSMIWGIFPELFPERNISWESHFWGLVTGLLLALYFRKLGPQKKRYDWEDEEDEEDELESDDINKTIHINYHIKKEPPPKAE